MTRRIAAVLLLAAAGAARADSASFAVDRFQLDPGAHGILNLAGARVPEQRDLNVSLGLGWANGLLRIERGGTTRDLVGSTFGGQLGASLALDGKHELSLVLPLALSRDTGSPGRVRAASVTGVGDLEVAGKVLLPGVGPVKLAAALPITLPTAKKDALLGEGAVTATPTAIAETSAGPVRVVANLGVAIRPTRTYYDLKVGPAVTWGAAGELPLQPFGLPLPLTALGSLWGEVGLRDGGSQARPTELDVGVRWLAPLGIGVTAGVGTAVVNGYGAPALRVFALAGWHPPLPARRKVEAPAPAPEPAPEPPPAPVVREEPPPAPVDPCAAGTAQASPEACPDLDHDGDGIPNGKDRCPIVAGVAEEQGCPAQPPAPAPDPCAAGTTHAPERCPDLDDDGDGVPNGKDRCPLLPGVAEHQGCPPPKAVLTEEKIEIKEAVFFDSGKEVIQPRSFQLLDDVARILEDHPEVKGVSIEGHTDGSGPAARNQQLSERRAAAVKVYLVKKGVASERLEARGFGATRPVAKEVDAAAKAKNRRVEFLVRP